MAVCKQRESLNDVSGAVDLKVLNAAIFRVVTKALLNEIE